MALAAGLPHEYPLRSRRIAMLVSSSYEIAPALHIP